MQPVKTLLLSTFLAFALLAPLAAQTPRVEAGPGARADTQGFLYGKVTTRSDAVYEGRLRWDDEEAFWGDYFNSNKEDPDFLDDLPRDSRRRRQPIKIFGITVGITWDDDWGHQYVARFGDIERIEVGRSDRATVHMKRGSAVEVDGGSNDIDGTIVVWDRGVGRLELEWDSLRTIEFLPAPSDLDVGVHRLYGTVKTEAGDFRGYVQWDKEECLSTDKLDGETRDGKLSIEMGNLRSIERRSRSSSRVVLQDGREYVLDGTNDVDDDNRGIYVEDPRYGRVLVSWDAFERVDFERPPTSGPAYGDFRGGGPLKGRVTLRGDRTVSGRIVYDLDEAEGWELLNGSRRDVEYDIPFHMIRTIVPGGRDTSEIILKNGERLELGDSVDVNEENSGLLVYESGERRPTYVEWDDVERIDFE